MSGTPSAGRLAVVVAVAVVLLGLAMPVLAQAPGGWIEKADSTEVRARWTPSDIDAFLPGRGKFSFPAPYSTEGIRITNATDCGGADCVSTPGGSYWRNINNHTGSDGILIFLGLRGVGPTLFRYDKLTGHVEKLGPLFEASSPWATHSGEGWYFSATQPNTLYVSNGGPDLLRYDVQGRTLQTVFDATTQFGVGRYIWRSHSSDDDNVHSAVLRDLVSDETLGCLAYQENVQRFFYHPATESLQECQVDKSGRWLLIKEDVDGVSGTDNRIVDLETGAETLLLDPDGAAGGSDNGHGYMVANDDRHALPGAVRVWNFADRALPGPLVYHTTSAAAGNFEFIAHSNARPGVAIGEQYACGTQVTTAVAPRANEIVCFRLDGSLDVLVVTQNMTDPNSSGDADSFSKVPKGNLDVTGGYFIWTSNMGGSRVDAFMVKVPSHLLQGALPDPAPPSVSINERSGSVSTGFIGVTESTDDMAMATGTPDASSAMCGLTDGLVHTLPSLTPPAKGQSYVDPIFGCTIKRLSDATAEGTTDVEHLYASVNPFNTNSTMILVERGGGAMQIRDLNGNVIRDSPPGISPTSDAFWSRTDSNLMYFKSGNQLRSYNVTTNTSTTLHTFSAYGAVSFGMGEGDISWDGDHLPVVADGRWAFIFTISTRTSTKTVDLAAYGSPNHADVTPSNQFYAAFGSGTHVWDQAMNYKRKIIDNAPHADRTADVDGTDVAVVSNAAVTNLLPSCVNGQVKINLDTGAPLCIKGFTWDFATHTSCNNVGQGWCLVSTYSQTGWAAYENELLMIKLDGSETRRLAHHRSTASTYGRIPRAAVSGDGKYVLFNSDMQGSGRDVYLLIVPDVGGGDLTPPVLSSVSASSVTTAGASIVWTTNEPADSQVEYGLTSAYGSSTTLNGSLLLAHAHALSGLTPGTLYHYRVKSRDAAGNLAISGDFTFTTLSVDLTPPVLSSVSASGVNSAGATIVWATNEPADSQVEYGTSTAYGSSTALDISLVLSHSRALSGLTSGTLYHYRVKSRDAAGNPAVSGDFTFTTLSGIDAGLIVHLKLDEGSGTVAADSSGNGNAGTLMNGAAWTAGSNGQGVALDGVDDHVRIPHAAMLNAFPLSVAVWFKTSTTAGVRGLVNKYVASSSNGYQLFFADGDLCAWYLRDTSNYVYAGGGCTMRTAGYNDGGWHQAVLVVDALGGRLYVDGVQKATQAWTGLAGAPSTIQDVHLGHYPGAFGGAEYLPGTVDELRLYNRALSADDALRLYNDGLPVGDTTPPLISGVGVDSIDATDAIISWTTDEPADTQVEYGTTSAYGSSTTLNSTLVTSHSQALTGLASSTVYHYRVKSKDAAGNLAVSADFTFKTVVTPATRLNVDGPPNLAGVVSPFTVGGWAFDAAAGVGAGPGVNLVSVHDGTSCAAPILAQTTPNLARPDVRSFFGLDASYGNTGFALAVRPPTAGLFTYTVCARSTVDNQYHASMTLNVRVSSALMYVDSPAPGTTVQRTVSISGWAFDAGAATGPGVDLVRIFQGGTCSGTVLGDAALGGSRPDVQTAFGLPAGFGNTGFAATITMPEAGAQQVTVCARSVVTLIFAAQATRSFTVSSTLLNVDGPSEGTGVTQPFAVGGWAFDAAAATGPGVDLVRVFAGTSCAGAALADATLGLPRPDVRAAFALPASFENTGYNATVTPPGAGPQTFTVCARSVLTGSFAAQATRTVNVSNTFMNVDGPAHGASVSSTFAVGGWAFDNGAGQKGPGVDLVRIFQGGSCSGTILATATLGISRPDVQAAFGLPESYASTGFSASVSAAAGSLSLTVCARSTVTGTFTRSITQTASVGG